MLTSVCKVLLVIVFISASNGLLFAQQDPQFSQIVFNQAFINPGYAGSESDDLFNVTLFNRNQTTGFEGSPVTTTLNANGPLNLGNTEGGINLSVMNENVGFFTTYSFALGYAYRFNLGKGKMGIGLSLGFLTNSIDPKGGWNLPEAGGDDGAIVPSKSSKAGFDSGLGAYYNDDKWFAGVSCTHLNQPTITSAESSSKLKQNFYILGGYKFVIPSNSDLVLKPSLLISTDFVSTLYSFSTMLDYKKKFWGGLGYRYKTALIGMIGVNLFSTLKIGYSYDYSTSKLSKFSNGSHEFMLSYSFAIIRKKGKQQYRSIRYL